MSSPKQSIPKVVGIKRQLELYHPSDDELDPKCIKVDSDVETVDLESITPLSKNYPEPMFLKSYP
jgi:hypothetical protein